MNEIKASQMITILQRLIKEEDLPILIQIGENFVPPRRTRIVNTIDQNGNKSKAVLLE